MVNKVEIKGFQEFVAYAEKIDPKGPAVFFYFSGEKLDNGVSWCPDCVEVKMVKHDKHKVKTLEIGSYEDFTEYVDSLPENTHNVYFLFTGKKKENGRSWCIYCQLAEPIVKAYLDELKHEVVFAYVDVGAREYWKDPACPFRTDARCKLMVIPTILKWKGVQRLEGSQCNKRDLLQMMFEDEE